MWAWPCNTCVVYIWYDKTYGDVLCMPYIMMGTLCTWSSNNVYYYDEQMNKWLKKVWRYDELLAVVALWHYDVHTFHRVYYLYIIPILHIMTAITLIMTTSLVHYDREIIIAYYMAICQSLWPWTSHLVALPAIKCNPGSGHWCIVGIKSQLCCVVILYNNNAVYIYCDLWFL